MYNREMLASLYLNTPGKERVVFYVLLFTQEVPARKKWVTQFMGPCLGALAQDIDVLIQIKTLSTTCTFVSIFYLEAIME